MDQHTQPIDEEEINYSRLVAVRGKDQSAHGKFHYSLSRLILLKNGHRRVPGVVTLGCVVETDIERLETGKEQDFGLIKIMFYILFDKRQISHIKRIFPESDFKYVEHNNNEAVVLNWGIYKTLLPSED